METEYLKLIYDCLPGVIVLLVAVLLVLVFIALMFWIHYFSDRHAKYHRTIEYIESVCERYMDREWSDYFDRIWRRK